LHPRLKSFLKLVLFLTFGVLILYLVYATLNKSYTEHCALDGIPLEDCSLLNKVLKDFSGLNYWWVALACLAFLLSNVSRALRWQMLLHPLHIRASFTNAFLTTMIGYFVNLGFPRAGELARPALLARYEKAPFDKIMGTIVIDRLVDFVFLFLFMGLALFFQYGVVMDFLEEEASLTLRSTWLIIIPILTAGLLAIVLWRTRGYWRKHALYIRVRNLLLGFKDGLTSVLKLKNLTAFILHSALIWILYFAMPILLFQSYAGTAGLGFDAGLAVFVFGALGIVVPSPGGMGTYHFMVIAALALYGIDSFTGFTYANVAFFSINIFCNVFFGVLGLILLPAFNLRKHERLDRSAGN
jgi:uncharacterized protein (TIRG00374 family)